MNTISFSHTLPKVLSGEKTQTRRIWKKNWAKQFNCYGTSASTSIVNAETESNVFYVGGVHTVVGGRGKPAVWFKENHIEGVARYSVRDAKTQTFDDEGFLWSNRDERKELIESSWQPLKIRVLHLRIEDVRNISQEDLKAEGFESFIQFIFTWCVMHDKPAHKAILHRTTALQMIAVGRPNYIEDSTWGMLKERPDNRYKAVVLDFEVVK